MELTSLALGALQNQGPEPTRAWPEFLLQSHGFQGLPHAHLPPELKHESPPHPVPSPGLCLKIFQVSSQLARRWPSLTTPGKGQGSSQISTNMWYFPHCGSSQVAWSVTLTKVMFSGAETTVCSFYSSWSKYGSKHSVKHLWNECRKITG